MNRRRREKKRNREWEGEEGATLRRDAAKTRSSSFSSGTGACLYFGDASGECFVQSRREIATFRRTDPPQAHPVPFASLRSLFSTRACNIYEVHRVATSRASAPLRSSSLVHHVRTKLHNSTLLASLISILARGKEFSIFLRLCIPLTSSFDNYLTSHHHGN